MAKWRVLIAAMDTVKESAAEAIEQLKDNELWRLPC